MNTRIHVHQEKGFSNQFYMYQISPKYFSVKTFAKVRKNLLNTQASILLFLVSL